MTMLGMLLISTCYRTDIAVRFTMKKAARKPTLVTTIEGALFDGTLWWLLSLFFSRQQSTSVRVGVARRDMCGLYVSCLYMLLLLWFDGKNKRWFCPPKSLGRNGRSKIP
jgi:hypothetical protein